MNEYTSMAIHILHSRNVLWEERLVNLINQQTKVIQLSNGHCGAIQCRLPFIKHILSKP